MELEKIIDEILNNYLKNGSDKRTLPSLTVEL